MCTRLDIKAKRALQQGPKGGEAVAPYDWLRALLLHLRIIASRKLGRHLPKTYTWLLLPFHIF